MRLPRDLSGTELAKKLETLGYTVSRQTGSHIRLSTQQHGEHHLTVPAHSPLRVGTLASILAELGTHFKMSRDELIQKLF
jgi:predicted RNA binding protein YcfA (HicA-like mRNA interferase family)